MAHISDPRAMRALAHPLRIQLLEMVIARGQATATELADELDQNPSNCSFHLRKLAEFGYVQRADDATGREKPWRAADPVQDISPDPHDGEAIAASVAVRAAMREWDVARMQAADGRQNPENWQGATFQRGSTLIVTPDEARSLSRALADLLAPFEGRLVDRTARPAGAGYLRLFAAATYLPEYQATLEGSGRADDDPSHGPAADAERPSTSTGERR